MTVVGKIRRFDRSFKDILPMALRRTRTSATLAANTFELSMAAPQVVAHRVSRMLTAGPVLSARDRKEFQGMSAEKTAAFYQSWAAMWAKGFEVQTAALKSMMLPGAAFRAGSGQALMNRQAAGLTKIVEAGLRPVHSKAVSNAKRLSRTAR